MKFYLLETTMVPGAYKVAGFREALAGHMAFVKQQYADGIILFSGTKPDNSGGVRVLKIPDEADVTDFWKLDPMTAAGLLDYRVTAFSPLDMDASAKEWFD